MQKAIAILTNLLELLGLVLISVGIYLAFGVAVAMVSAGLMLIGVSFLITYRGGRK
jgi:K+-transporting ATPase A subunit